MTQTVSIELLLIAQGSAAHGFRNCLRHAMRRSTPLISCRAYHVHFLHNQQHCAPLSAWDSSCRVHPSSNANSRQPLHGIGHHFAHVMCPSHLRQLCAPLRAWDSSCHVHLSSPKVYFRQTHAHYGTRVASSRVPRSGNY